MGSTFTRRSSVRSTHSAFLFVRLTYWVTGVGPPLPLRPPLWPATGSVVMAQLTTCTARQASHPFSTLLESMTASAIARQLPGERTAHFEPLATRQPQKACMVCTPMAPSWLDAFLSLLGMPSFTRSPRTRQQRRLPVHSRRRATPSAQPPPVLPSQSPPRDHATSQFHTRSSLLPHSPHALAANATAIGVSLANRNPSSASLAVPAWAVAS